MRKNTEHPLSTNKGSEQALVAGLQNAQQSLVFELDAEARLVHFDHAIQVFSDFRLKDVQGLDWCKTFVPERDRKRVRKIIKQAIKDKHNQTHSNINHIIRKDGSERLIEWYGKPLRDTQGNTTGLLIIGQDITEIKRAGEKTFKILKQNRDMSRYIFEAQEIERQYLARQLHDEFGQWLTAIQLNIQSITNRIGAHSPEVDASIESITHSAHQIHRGIRNIIQSLRPVLLDQLGLADSLRELIAQWREQHPESSCQLRLEGEVNNLTENLNITLYRLVQDGLDFAAKHARASHIIVHLVRQYHTAMGEDSLILTLEDHGIDIPPESLDYEFGLLNMRERTLSAGGLFNIDHQHENEMQIRAQLFINHDMNNLQS